MSERSPVPFTAFEIPFVVFCHSHFATAIEKMHASDPYQPPNDSQSTPAIVRRSRNHWALVGFLVFGIVPVGFGLARLHHESVYYVSLLPGTAACGMGSLGGIVMIVFGGPFFGLIGAAAGSIASRLFR